MKHAEEKVNILRKIVHQVGFIYKTLGKNLLGQMLPRGFYNSVLQLSSE